MDDDEEGCFAGMLFLLLVVVEEEREGVALVVEVECFFVAEALCAELLVVCLPFVVEAAAAVLECPPGA